MKIRLMGTDVECVAVLVRLNNLPGLELLEIAGPYPNRPPSRLMRFYLDVQIVDASRLATLGEIR